MLLSSRTFYKKPDLLKANPHGMEGLSIQFTVEERDVKIKKDSLKHAQGQRVNKW